MIHVEAKHLKVIRDILSKHAYTFYAFGSRVKGTHKPFSDLDLCSMEDIPDLTKSYLDEAFEKSDLPFMVDIIQWNKISDEFRALIKNDLTPL
ncbi:MAG TPA: nucleotidyltransferase domain-containing protein [Chlamydiales bacterium]|nr:nucleotidyltransferase domain-containing protein [Chlamydiales bacterium]